MKSLVLCSGGMDSAVCLALAAQYGPVETLNCNYGQTHQQERAASRKLSEYYKAVAHYEVTLPDVFKGAGSTLVDEGLQHPHMTYAEIRDAKGVSPTYVPFRNGNLLAVAAAKALTRECEAIWFGAHAEDARNFAYPDCTSEFTGAMANAIYVGTYHKVRLFTPLQWLMKKDIVRLGLELGVPFSLSRTCYSSDTIACGLCPSCIERLHAFRANGIEDPISYQTRGE